ncbi:MAG TPA: hypothetical protein VHB73_00440, partial [Alphaproteobacteria bacterium]|nr:hypothetical protein [Alphaproteobacteria bacterium]
MTNLALAAPSVDLYSVEDIFLKIDAEILKRADYQDDAGNPHTIKFSKVGTTFFEDGTLADPTSVHGFFGLLDQPAITANPLGLNNFEANPFQRARSRFLAAAYCL